MSVEADHVENVAPSFKDLFSADISLLRFVGASSMNDILTSAPRRERWWEFSSSVCGVSVPSFVLFCEFVTVYLAAKSDLNYMVEALTATFSGLLSIMKGIRLWTHRADLYNLLQYLAKLWQTAKTNNAITPKMIETAKKTRFTRFCYCCVVVVLALSYCLRPYMNESYDFSTSIYPATYPFSNQNYTQYLICLAYEVVVMVCVISYWLTCDGLFAQLITHLSLQFEIMANELEEIGSKKDHFHTKSYIKKKLSAITERHNEMFLYCSVAENFFNPIIFLTMLINGAHCCFCMYSLEKEISDGNVNEVMKNLFHVVALSGQTVLYCGYADRLTRQAAKIREAIYNSPWVDQTETVKLMLLTILIRAQKEYSYTAYGIIKLNLQQVTTIANAAMRYFTLLRSL